MTPPELRINVVVDDDSLRAMREWITRTNELQAAVNRALRDLEDHIRSGPPHIFATLDQPAPDYSDMPDEDHLEEAILAVASTETVTKAEYDKRSK